MQTFLNIGADVAKDAVVVACAAQSFPFRNADAFVAFTGFDPRANGLDYWRFYLELELEPWKSHSATT